jgi:hypothetical protein
MKTTHYLVEVGYGLPKFEIYRDGNSWVATNWSTDAVIQRGALAKCLTEIRKALREHHDKEIAQAKDVLAEVEAVRAKIDDETRLPPEAP